MEVKEEKTEEKTEEIPEEKAEDVDPLKVLPAPYSPTQQDNGKHEVDHTERTLTSLERGSGIYQL